jgi:hypothetical protein
VRHNSKSNKGDKLKFMLHRKCFLFKEKKVAIQPEDKTKGKGEKESVLVISVGKGDCVISFSLN